MDYVHKAAIFQKVLIISAKSPNPLIAARDDKRFGRFTAILGAAGFAAHHAYAENIEHLSELVEHHSPDIVFSCLDHLPEYASSAPPGNAAERRPVNVHAWLEASGIPYVGSPPDVIELALSKAALKEKWSRDGIATPQFRKFIAGEDLSALSGDTLPPFPCIVKPSDSGNSRGITQDSVVFDMPALREALKRLARDFDGILAEHYLGLYPDFHEITCACIGNGDNRLVMPAEIVFNETRRIHVVTNEDKDEHKTRAEKIARADLRDGAVAFAGLVFASTGVRDYSRCDLVYANGGFWAIEVNGQPMIPDEWFGACALHAGLSEQQYIMAIFRAAMNRSGG